MHNRPGREPRGENQGRHRKGRKLSPGGRRRRLRKRRTQRRARRGLVNAAQSLAALIGGTHPTRTMPDLPGHQPKTRSVERIDGGFVRVAGWLIKYRPTREHRDLIELAAWRARYAT